MIVDIHSHIIPGIDDGSKDMNMTLEMLRNAERDGTKEIVATPHYLLEYGEATIDEIKNYVQDINTILREEKLNIKVYSGQEVYFNENILEYYIEGKIGTINDSRYMLIEFPMEKFDENIVDILYELQVRGIVPIIAHPERYRSIREKPSFINRFINEGYLFQVNAGSIEGRFGDKVKKTANILLEHNIYNFIGSDAHDINNRNTGLKDALLLIKKSINKDIIKNSSEKLIENGSVEFVGKKIKEKRTIFSFLSK